MNLSGFAPHTPQPAAWVVVVKDLSFLHSVEQCNLFEPGVPDPSHEDNTEVSADTFETSERLCVCVKPLSPQNTLAVITAVWLVSCCLVCDGTTPLMILRLRCWRTKLL